MGRVIGFGTAALDYRIRTADLGIGYAEKLLAREIDVLGAGTIANCLVQASRLGGTAVWLGKLGRDRLAETRESRRCLSRWPALRSGRQPGL